MYCVCPTGLSARMDAILALVALMAVTAAMAAVLSTLSKAAILALLAIAPCIYKYREQLYIILITLPRDTRFLWRYAKGMIRMKRYARRDATVAELFTQRALAQPDVPCFTVVDGRTWTYKEVASKSNQIARVMQEQLGLRRGDVVCVLMPNCVEYVWTWLGMAKLGVVSALINNNLRRKPLLHCINVAKAKAIIFSEDLADAIAEVRNELPPDLKLFQLNGSCEPGVIDIGAEIDKHAPDYPEVPEKLHFKDTLLYIYTSGTTGMPKAAVMPNSRYILASVAVVQMMGVRTGDRVYNCLPLYHTAGGIVGTSLALLEGIHVIIRSKFSASNFWTDCIKYECTVAQYIGEMCRYLVAQAPRDTDRRHRVRLLLGNGLRAAVWHQVLDRFNVPQITEFYGATEGNSNILNMDNTLGAVGFFLKLVPMRYQPIALIKADEEGNLIRGTDGFCVRCAPNEPGMFIGMITKGDAYREYHGYVNEGESSKKMVRDVFKIGDAAFVSGDMLVADEFGYLRFRERTGDSYRWKGENVSAAEVEAALAHLVCIVYGVTIPNTEGRAGMVAIKDSEQSLDFDRLAHHVDRSLPSYARPLFLRIVNDIEITGTFKLKKLNYQKEGFDPDVIKDPLYFRSGTSFVPITTQLFTDICTGKVKL